MSFWKTPVLEALVIENPADIPADQSSVAVCFPVKEDLDKNLVELGIWLSGLRSYVACNTGKFHRQDGTGTDRNVSTHFHIIHSGLERCILLTSNVLSRAESCREAGSELSPVLAADLLDLSHLLYNAISLSESLINSRLLGAAQWKAWSDMLSRRLDEVEAYHSLVHLAEKTGATLLPECLARLGADARSVSAEHAELILVLPRFGMVLKWLSVIGKMLESDQPLKSTLLIFSRVNELVLDLNRYIGNRLDRFPDQDADLFATLDAAAYTASIELKKVYGQELAGVALMRPTPSIYARIETAHALLYDSFQQILAGFARIVNGEKDVIDIFPEFRLKLDRSLALRSDLWSAIQAVKQAERSPEADQIDKMKRIIGDLRQGSMRYLFYKDIETVERFIEEILVTNQNKDLVPLLHRFGAFLETLFGQVSLRSVLEKHPFKKPDGE